MIRSIYTHFVDSLVIINRCWVLSSPFPTSIDFFILGLFDVMDHINCFTDVEPIKLLEENIRSKPSDISLNNIFLDRWGQREAKFGRRICGSDERNWPKLMLCLDLQPSGWGHVWRAWQANYHNIQLYNRPSRWAWRWLCLSLEICAWVTRSDPWLVIWDKSSSWVERW